MKSLKLSIRAIYFSALEQHAKKVMSGSQGLVDFAIRLVKSVLNLLNGQVNFWGEFKLKKDSNRSHLSKNFFRLVIMTLVRGSTC